MVDWTGHKSGYITAIKHNGYSKSGHPLWECLCECGNITFVRSSSLKGGTKSCGCKRRRDRRNNPLWKGCGNINGRYWTTLQRGASSRNFVFEVTIQHAWNLFEDQGRLCKLSGVPIYFAETDLERNYGGATASFDRIDSKLGYIVGNVQWVHKDVNRMKQNFNEDYFIETCGKIYNHNKGITNATDIQ